MVLVTGRLVVVLGLFVIYPTVVVWLHELWHLLARIFLHVPGTLVAPSARLGHHRFFETRLTPFHTIYLALLPGSAMVRPWPHPKLGRRQQLILALSGAAGSFVISTALFIIAFFSRWHWRFYVGWIAELFLLDVIAQVWPLPPRPLYWKKQYHQAPGMFQNGERVTRTGNDEYEALRVRGEPSPPQTAIRGLRCIGTVLIIFMLLAGIALVSHP